MTFGIAIFLTNLIVVAAIRRGGHKLHKATFYCICNLAIADMLAGLLLLWIFGLQREVLEFRTALSELVQKSVWTLTVWTSLLSQVIIAIDRYSHVTRGSRNATYPGGCRKWGTKQRKRMVIFGILMTWIIPTVTFVIPVMTIWNCRKSCSCHVTPENVEVIYMICEPVSSCSQINPPFAKSSMLFLSLVLLLLPFLPVILYSKIFIFVRNSSKNLCPPGNASSRIVITGTDTENEWTTKRGDCASHENYSREESSGSKTEALIGEEDSIQGRDTKRESFSHSASEKWSHKFLRSANMPSKNNHKYQKNGSSAASGEGRERLDSSILKSRQKSTSSNNPLRKRSQRRDMRLLRTLVIILALFLISTVPLGLLFLISITETDKRYVKPAKYLLTLSLLNSLVNPWVYFWRFREMRHAIRHLFCSPCSGNRKMSNARDEDGCVCCQLPPVRKKKIFSSVQSGNSRRGASSSKDNSSSSAF